MLSGIHFLLTYTCMFECDHCFLYCSPRAEGTFTLDQIRQVLGEAKKMESVEWIYYEGGEPLLYYPLLVEGIRLANEMGFHTGIVTNAYMAGSINDAKLFLKPLKDAGVSFVSISDDSFHSGGGESPAQLALKAAEQLNIPFGRICIEKPGINTEDKTGKGTPIEGGTALFKGRAAEKLADQCSKLPARGFTECRNEELEEPERVHVDAFGNVHICQGLVIGNMWETPLSMLIDNYVAETHPICSALVKGGPVLLADRYGVAVEDSYADACHMCYQTRLALLDRFPGFLIPRQVYGLE